MPTALAATRMPIFGATVVVFPRCVGSKFSKFEEETRVAK